jgi:hypothetical protein
LRTLSLIACLLCLCACAERIATAPLREQSDALRIQLMRTESEVYGDFHKLRTFHNDLYQTIRKDDVAPYPALKQLFDTLFIEANKAVGARVYYDTTFNSLQEAMKGKKKISLQPPFTDLYQRFTPLPNKLPNEQKQHRDIYFELRKAYQDSCLRYGIIRLDPQQYAGILNEKLVQWQDSLEEVGRMIARCKNDLTARYPVQKGKDFFAAYSPVSELEAMLKNFDSILNQFQNSISRFEEGNNQDFIYFGPYIRQRLEVSANDDLVGQLSIQMKDCRSKESEYFKQFR